MAKEPRRLISLTETCRRVNKSRWWIREQIAAGKFPKPVRNGRASDFFEDEIDSHLERLSAEREAA